MPLSPEFLAAVKANMPTEEEFKEDFIDDVQAVRDVLDSLFGSGNQEQWGFDVDGRLWVVLIQLETLLNDLRAAVSTEEEEEE